MILEKSFFEGETREGFYVEPLMKHCWAAQMEVLQMVDQICKENHIKYFVDWGTLLGAVRHKGYIPWDDDMDICMLRPDYLRFIQVMEHFEGDITCCSIYNTPDWGQHATRVTNMNGLSIERQFLKKFHGCPFATGLDVFPVDYIPRDKNLEKEMLLVINLVMHAVFLKEDMTNPKPETDLWEVLKEYKETIKLIEDTCHMKFSSENPTEQELLILREEISGLYGPDDSDYVSAIHRLLNKCPYYVPKEGYAEAIMMPFESIEVPVPVGYDKVLTEKYGDYMVPRNVGGGHGYPYYGPTIEAISKLNHHKNLEETKDYIRRVCTDYYFALQERVDGPRLAFDAASELTPKEKAIAEIRDEIERICEVHDFAYSYHEDGSILLPRADYMQFLKVIQEELDAWFDYRSIYTHSNQLDLDIHILTDYENTDLKTYIKRFHGCEEPVELIVCPIDEQANDEEQQRVQQSIVEKLVETARVFPNEPPYSDDILAVARQWGEMFGVTIEEERHLADEFMKLADRVRSMNEGA